MLFRSAKKATASKTATKAKTHEVYVQYEGKEISANSILEQVKKIWTDNLGKKVSDIKDIKIYIKPQESKAYYVINDVTGSVDI